MEPGAILREAYALYKAHWKHLIPIAFVFYVGLGLITLLLTVALGVFGALVGSLISIIGVFWLQGTLVEAIADIRDGTADLSIGQTFSKAKAHIGKLLGAGILAGLAIVVGLLLFIVPGLYLMTIWSVLIPVIVLEGRGVMEAFGRSRQLVRGNGWNVFGVIILTIVILIVVSIVLSLLLFWIPDTLGEYIRGVISNSIIVPFVALAWTLMYYALRARETSAAPAATMPPAEPPPATV